MRASSLPAASTMSASANTTERPNFSTRPSNHTVVPTFAGAKKLTLNSIVGTPTRRWLFAITAVAAASSSAVVAIPPCRLPIGLQNCGVTSIR